MNRSDMPEFTKEQIMIAIDHIRDRHHGLINLMKRREDGHNELSEEEWNRKMFSIAPSLGELSFVENLIQAAHILYLIRKELRENDIITDKY